MSGSSLVARRASAPRPCRARGPDGSTASPERGAALTLPSSTPHDQAAGQDHVMNPWAWRRKREVARAREYVPQFTTESEPPEPSGVDTSPNLTGARIGFAHIEDG